MTFNEAARMYSIDKAGRSGLLGWKRKTELDQVTPRTTIRSNNDPPRSDAVSTPQDFWAAAIATADGKYTAEPVRTQYGYHIIRVEARK
jgi:hypothetical protein